MHLPLVDGTFVAIIQIQKRRRQRVQSLPVHIVRMRRHPRLEQPLQLEMALRCGQQLVVLMAPRNIHLDLTIRRRCGVLVDPSVATVFKDAQQTCPNVAAQQGRNVSLRLGHYHVARKRIALQQAMEQHDPMKLVFGVAFTYDQRQALHVGGVIVVAVVGRMDKWVKRCAAHSC